MHPVIWCESRLYNFGVSSNEFQRDIISCELVREATYGREALYADQNQNSDAGTGVVKVIDAVCNLLRAEALEFLPDDRNEFCVAKMRGDTECYRGICLGHMLKQMDAADIDKAFLIAHRSGPQCLVACWRLPYELVVSAVASHPDRFRALAGIDLTDGMQSAYALGHTVRELGFIGAGGYPHWFELAPDHACWHPFLR